MNNLEVPKIPSQKYQWDWPLQYKTEGTVNVKNTMERFEVDLDVPCFKSNEIEVKVCRGELVIRCQQEPDSTGVKPREIHRAYRLPPDVDATTLRSQLNNRGTLVITALKKRKSG